MKRILLIAIVFFNSIGLNSYAQEADGNSVITAMDSATPINTVDPITEVPEFSADVIQNLNAKGTISGAELAWNLEYESIDQIANIIIRYKRKIDKKKPWIHSKILSSSTTSLKLSDLRKSEKYVWEVGMRKNGGDISEIIQDGSPNSEEMVWSKKAKFKTDRPWGLYKFLVLLGALGLFIFGMKMMSEGLQQSAGNRLRQILSGMTSNRYLGVLSGFLITALVQSSSATTVMTVSFVNAGLLTLVESAGVMMGANIGTTITGWLVSIFGFKVSISSYALIIIAIGAPLMFFTKSKSKAWANTLIGFALLFMGLGFLKDAVPSLDADSPIIQFFSQYSDAKFFGRVMFVLLGTLVTIVVQSSSAAMALTLTLVMKGIIPFDVGAAMILGENIGTTITAELASLIGNVHAKRSARIHSMFNVVGVTWMIFLMPFFLRGIENFIPGNIQDGGTATIALAAFHTIFNATNVFVMIWLVPVLVRLAIRTVPSKGEEDEIFKLEYISTNILRTPELSLIEAKKEVSKFSQLTLKMSDKLKDLVNSVDQKKNDKLIKKLTKYEDITDRMEVEISDYLAAVSKEELSDDSSSQLRSMLSIITDLERIGDIYFEMGKALERKNEEKVWFDQTQRDRINTLIDTVREGLVIMNQNLAGPYKQSNLHPAKMKENEINELRDKLRRAHLRAVEKGDYNVKAGMVFSNLFASLERVGDHAINISEAMEGNMD